MTTPSTPPLADLLVSGRGDRVAEEVGDGIFMSRGVSNCYQVGTASGAVMINAGMRSEAEIHAERFATMGLGRVEMLIFTQSHPDHIGGWRSFAAPGVQIVAQAEFAAVRRYWTALAPYYGRRTRKLWGFLGASSGVTVPLDDPVPTVIVDSSRRLEHGGRAFEILSVPGGETTDSVAVLLPEDRTVFTGNLLGPMFGQVPNLATLRGDKLRSALAFVESVDRVRALHPEVVITGHGEPIRGADEISGALTRIRDAVMWVHDRTVEGMNEGLDVHTLMREVIPPESLRLGENHGTVRWNVRAIHDEYAGAFREGSTTELYDVPRSRVAGDLVELAGGVDAIVARASTHVEAGRPLEALHLLETVHAVEPEHADGTRVAVAAHQLLLERSGRGNLSETKWLEAEIDAVRTAGGE